jgi:hypothetical protein
MGKYDHNISGDFAYVRAVFSEGCLRAHRRHEERTLLMSTQATGSCLCKGVSYEIEATLNPILACHCSQCAKTSGNFAAMTSCAADKIRILSDATLRWFQSSETVSRGFCSRCGGNLFWKQADSSDIYITAGTLDEPTGVRISAHIFVASKSDFYDITDGLPQKEEW